MSLLFVYVCVCRVVLCCAMGGVCAKVLSAYCVVALVVFEYESDYCLTEFRLGLWCALKAIRLVSGMWRLFVIRYFAGILTPAK